LLLATLSIELIVLEKNVMPYNKENPNFDTPSELAEGKTIIEKYQKSQKSN
jgi:hypothetical protein